MTQVLNFRDAKITFRLFEEKLVLGEDMENLIYMGEMGWPSFTIDENTIKYNLHKVTEERKKEFMRL
jgi:hypothetical protein